MPGQFRGVRPLLRLVFALGFLVAWVGAPPAAGAAAPRWDGGVDVYRAGTFTTQRSWLWCTAADLQIVRNIVDHRRDHTTSGQRRYFTWMRGHNRYSLPLSAGVDPGGWTAGLRHFVDDRYRLVASRTFDAALRLAVKRLRQTNLPVAIAVSHGNHGWILTGFRATADPLVTSAFRVTSVRVVGPLWGLQSRTYGYDMRPDTRLTVAQFRTFFTPWKYRPRPMIWDGRYVSIQPVPGSRTTAAAATLRPSPTATPTPTPTPTVAPSPTTSVAPTTSPTVPPSPSAITGAVSTTGPPPPSPDVVPGILVVMAVGGGFALVALSRAGLGRREDRAR